MVIDRGAGGNGKFFKMKYPFIAIVLIFSKVRMFCKDGLG
jgi:hypothetical protein